jgi:hypothetical protein
MSSPVLTPANAPTSTIAKPTFRRKILLAVILLAAILVILAIFLLSRAWPFSEKAVVQDLAEASDSTVTIRGFHPKYFPFPGCVLEGLVFHHGARQFTLITIDKLDITGSYLGILRRHVSRIKAEGGHVLVPPFGSNLTFNTTHSNIVIDEIVADGTVVEFASKDAPTRDPQKKDLPVNQPFRFDVHEAELHNVRWDEPFTYRVKLHNPQPPGEITASGKFGAWTTGHPGDTPVSGEYTFEHADLGVYGGIDGTLDSKGKFGGVLSHINIEGTTITPDFEVTSGGHKEKLESKFDAHVDGTRGDTFLSRVDARLGRSLVVTKGSVAGAEGKEGKSAQLNLSSIHGRIEDMLGLFVSGRSPMSGEVALRAKVEIPSGDRKFLEKVKLQGTFGIDDGSFSQADTQNNVNELSAGARGENKDDPETVLTDLKGRVALDHGVANFSDLTFHIPGAGARLHGTFNLLNYKIDLHGDMRVDTQISKTSSGVKALLLKAMDPLFKKKKKGEVVPVHIGGTYNHPDFGLDLAHSEADKKSHK